ncbi:MAG TPA: DNRLRE domain-containing protein [Thermoanaerobaculia bacterium]|nr:DNRLRE domain-containing protein [Thermoanaerobaculia bacterium]
MSLLSHPQKIRLAAFLSLALFPSLNAAQAVVTTTIVDTYVAATTPTQNFGSAETLNVNSQSIALIKFDLSSLPGGTTANSISKATLHLWVNTASPNPAGDVNVFPIAADWNGTTVNWTTKPANLGTPKATKTLKAGGSNYYLEVDVTDHVKLWLTTPAKNFGIAVVAATPSLSVVFDSKENTTTSHPAILDTTLFSGKTFAVCLNGTQSNTCTCPGKQLNKVTGGSCQVTSETGTCGAIQAGQTINRPLASCCVCAP